MDTKHTRGPWKVGEELASDGDFVIKATSGYGIGQAWNLNGNTENAANARLIAAAPGLLEALYQIATYDPTKWDAVTLGNIARAAIVKAGGQ